MDDVVVGGWEKGFMYGIVGIPDGQECWMEQKEGIIIIMIIRRRCRRRNNAYLGGCSLDSPTFPTGAANLLYSC